MNQVICCLLYWLDRASVQSILCDSKYFDSSASANAAISNCKKRIYKAYQDKKISLLFIKITQTSQKIDAKTRNEIQQKGREEQKEVNDKFMDGL